MTSPTFVTLNLYENVAHFDLYRVEKLENFIACGFTEYLEEPYIAIVEWPEIIRPLLSGFVYHVEIESGEGDERIYHGI